MEKEDKVYWLANSDEGKQYSRSTWYRCVGLQDFLEKVEKEDKIVAIVVNDNNIGFILDN